MSSDDIVLSVKNVSKRFEMYDKPRHRLQQMLLGPFGKKYYREFWALRDINFEVHRGECVGVIGRNGAGKSTLLQIVTGTLQPTFGEVSIQGRVAALLELGSGFNPEFTGRENVYMNAAILGLTKKETDDKFQEIVDFADIGEFIDQPVKTYSSGMMVRLAFAVNVAVNPDVLIVDEALAVGDIAFQQKCYTRIRQLIEKKVSIIFVSHDLGTIVNLCDTAILLHDHSILSIGSPDHVVEMFRKLLTTGKSRTDQETSANSKEQLSKINSKLLHNPNKKEYGNREVEILDWGILNPEGIPVDTVICGNSVSFFLKIHFNKQISSACIGFFLKDLKGNEITGTNTEYLKNSILYSRNDILLQFTQKIILAPGSYSVCFGCSGPDVKGSLVAYHRIYDALLLNVLRRNNFSGYFDPQTSLTIRYDNAEGMK